MSDQNLRVYPVEGDEYGEVQEFPRFAKYRMEPHFVGATGDAQTDLVVYEKDDSAEDGERELGRFTSSEVLILFPGQRTPTGVDLAEDDNKRTPTATPTHAKAGAPAKADKK